jgi:hypothetical protein
MEWLNGGAVSKGQPYSSWRKWCRIVYTKLKQDKSHNQLEAQVVENTNVNFTINATDVRGIKELLINNRSTIVNVINSALNEKGKEALV